MKCPKCNGKGILDPPEEIVFMEYNDFPQRYKKHIKECPFCKGDKELDWVDYITGVDVSENEKMFVKIFGEALKKIPRSK